MIEYKPIGHHIRWNHEATWPCDGRPSDDSDFPIGNMGALREARSDATLCPTCQ